MVGIIMCHCLFRLLVLVVTVAVSLVFIVTVKDS
jgi:hypothetical protein